jgi:hypothetical protein
VAIVDSTAVEVNQIHSHPNPCTIHNLFQSSGLSMRPSRVLFYFCARRVQANSYRDTKGRQIFSPACPSKRLDSDHQRLQGLCDPLLLVAISFNGLHAPKVESRQGGSSHFIRVYPEHGQYWALRTPVKRSVLFGLDAESYNGPKGDINPRLDPTPELRQKALDLWESMNLVKCRELPLAFPLYTACYICLFQKRAMSTLYLLSRMATRVLNLRGTLPRSSRQQTSGPIC